MPLFILNLFGKLPEGEEKKEEKQAEQTTEDRKEETTQEQEVTEVTNDKQDDVKTESEAETESEKEEEPRRKATEYERKLREEAKRYRLEKQKAEQELTTIKSRIEDEKKRAEREKLDIVERLKLEKAEAEAFAKQAQDIMKQYAIDNSIITVASKLGFADPEDAIALLGSKVNEFTINDEGEVSDDALSAELEEILAKKPYLKGIEQRKIEERAKEVTGKSINQPSETEVKRVVKRDEDEIEEYNKQIKDSLARHDAGTALKKYMQRFNKLAEKNRAKEIKTS